MISVAIAALDCALAAVYRRRPLSRDSHAVEVIVIASFDVAIVMSLLLAGRFRRGGVRGWAFPVLALWSILVMLTFAGLAIVLSQP